MPSTPVHPRRRDRPDSEDSEESETSDPSTQSSNKRRRLETDEPQSDEEGIYDGHVGDGEDDEGSSSESQQPSPTNGATQADSASTSQKRQPDSAGQNGFKPGAIVRIKLTNFVTYSSAEFFLGPKLNMVIGPNGTGKSTLVCAICLGLGWGPQV